MANTNLAQVIKQQILVNLQALKTAGNISTVVEIDQSPNPLTIVPRDGYPMAVVAMPRVESEFEDTITNKRTYRFDILFVLDPTKLTNPGEDVEVLIDAVLNRFDENFTLAGAAVASVLPMTIQGLPVSTGDKTLLVFTGTLMAQALFTI